jgi:hypothetical protein
MIIKNKRNICWESWRYLFNIDFKASYISSVILFIFINLLMCTDDDDDDDDDDEWEWNLEHLQQQKTLKNHRIVC